jgi:2,4-dienoyl-CoA reductase-like NADH-dependent reductase (Old Yellow Enzyme family)
VADADGFVIVRIEWPAKALVSFDAVSTSLSDKGLAYLHVVEGDLTAKPVPPFDYARIKNLFGGLYIANNGYDKSRAEAALAQQKADAIAFGESAEASSFMSVPQ